MNRHRGAALPALAAAASVPLLAAVVVSKSSVLAVALAAAGAVALPGGALALMGAARRLRRSLAELANSAQHMSPARPGQRFESARDPEVGELVRELNALLQRMSDAVELSVAP